MAKIMHGNLHGKSTHALAHTHGHIPSWKEMWEMKNETLTLTTRIINIRSEIDFPGLPFEIYININMYLLRVTIWLVYDFSIRLTSSTRIEVLSRIVVASTIRNPSNNTMQYNNAHERAWLARLHITFLARSFGWPVARWSTTDAQNTFTTSYSSTQIPCVTFFICVLWHEFCTLLLGFQENISSAETVAATKIFN